MRIQNQQNFWSGAMFIVVGLLFSWFATDYQMGTAARMGPGYFPFWLGIILAVLGASLSLGALSHRAQETKETKVEPFDWKSIILVLGAITLFALLLKPLGLYVSIFLLVTISSLASHHFDWKVALGTAVFLLIFSHVAFVKGLGLILPLYPWFIGY